ncbi:MAG: hypothetical protein WAN36_06745, partial [Calditrichia bacterium]
MKQLISFSLVLLLAISFVLTANAQVRVNGFLQSAGYGWENASENQQWDFYQSLRLRITPEQYQQLYLNTFLRGDYRGDPAEWNEKIYNLYLNWKVLPQAKLRVGRQFTYYGVINGTVDGALLS